MSDEIYWQLETLTSAMVAYEQKQIDKKLYKDICFYCRNQIKQRVYGKVGRDVEDSFSVDNHRR